MILGFWEINHIKKGLPKLTRNSLLYLTKPLSTSVTGVLTKQFAPALPIIDYQLIINKTVRVLLLQVVRSGRPRSTPCYRNRIFLPTIDIILFLTYFL